VLGEDRNQAHRAARARLPRPDRARGQLSSARARNTCDTRDIDVSGAQRSNVIAFPRAPSAKLGGVAPPLPSAVDVFAAWFRSQPADADLAQAAAKAIARIDARAPVHPDALLLRTMLGAFVG
jgi:hypothetical protein